MRTASVIVAVGAGVILLSRAYYWTSASAIGRELFGVILWAAFIACLLSGVFVTATLLCEERREGSLALLFLTDLAGFEIILGKLIAVGLLAGQVLLGALPVMAICIALGGVSLQEFWRAAQLLVVTLVFSLAVGLFVSALNKQISRSVLVSFGAIILSTALIGWVDWMARNRIAPSGIGGIVPGLIPAMTSLLDPEYQFPPQSFGRSLAWQAGFTAALLWLAASMLKRLAISDSLFSGWSMRFASAPAPAAKRQLRRNPIYWMSLRHRWRWLTTWILICLLVLFWTAALTIFDFSWRARMIAVFGMAPVLHLLLKTAIAAEAVERLSSARTGELELLLVTPLEPGKILRGHYKALRRLFVFPIITMVLADLLFAFCYEPPGGRSMRDSIAGYLFVYTLALTLVIDLPALVMRGLWNGLRCDTAARAVRRTLLEVVIFPIPVFAGTFTVLTVSLKALEQAFVFTRISDELDNSAWMTGAIVWWGVSSFVMNAFLQRNAGYNLKSWLRYIAADPAGARRRLRRKPRGSGQVKCLPFWLPQTEPQANR